MISVIVPVYNTAQYLCQCVDSILCQTCRDIEVFLIDDGSTDESGELCDHYAAMDERVTVVHQRNQGVSAARNHALKLIRGEWVSFVDSDDWLEPAMYESLIALAEKTRSGIVACDVYDEKRGATKHRNIWGAPGGTETVYEGGERWLPGFAYTPVLWNKLIKAEHICGVQFSENYRYGEDSLFLSAAVRNAQRIACFSEPLYHYRAEREGNVVSAAISDKMLDLLHSYDEICEGLVLAGEDRAAAQLVYTASLQVIFKLSLHGGMGVYCRELKYFIRKYSAQLRLIRHNYRISRSRIALVRIAGRAPLLSAVLWNLWQCLKKS